VNSASRPVTTTAISASTSSARRLIVAAALLVGVALLKPWPAAPASTSRSPATAPSPTVLAALEPTPLPSLRAGEIGCEGARWQIVSLDRLGSWTARTWLPIAPVAAFGPADPSIPRVALDGGGVLAVGACPDVDGGAPSAPGAPAPSPDVVAITAWRLPLPASAGSSTGGDTADPAPVPLVAVSGVAASRPGVATLYRPAGARLWPGGRYVFRLAPVSGTAVWVAVEVTAGSA
jgi:hypothetical protein